LRDDKLGLISREIRDLVTGLVVDDDCAIGYGEDDVFASGTVLMIAATRLAAGRTPVSLSMVGNESRQSMIDAKDHRPAITAVAAVGTAERFELLTMNGGATVPAVAAVYVQGDLIHECRDCHDGEPPLD
jgi:hypothetical protein